MVIASLDRRRWEKLALAGLGTALAAAALAVEPLGFLALAAVALGVGLAAWLAVSLSGLDLWQVITLAALAGYILLNYGFTNFCLPPGSPLVVGYALTYGALGLVLVGRAAPLGAVWREPAVASLFGLLGLAALHLASDVPRYGWWALRDASVFLEGLCLLLGLAWTRAANPAALWKWLLGVFIANTFYSFLMPWSDWLVEISPTTGVFLETPLVGHFTHTYLYLLAGALYSLGPARRLVSWPRWTLNALGVVQLLGLAIHQARSTYVALPVVLAALVAAGERRLAGKMMAVAATAGLALAAAAGMGLDLKGRMGPVRLEFLGEHFESLLLKPGTEQAALGSIEDRVGFSREVWARVTSSAARLAVGEGFGEPLVDFVIAGNVQVRQPHNTHLTVLARLGALGALLWAALHIGIWARFLAFFRRRLKFPPLISDLVVWLSLYHLISLIVTTVQPHLEFSHGAIPFYFLTGVALGMMRESTAAA